MFISNAEKDGIKMKIRALEARIRDLELEVNWTKNKLSSKRAVVVKTEVAPYGLKKDGTPRKKPGRQPRVMKVGQL